MQPVEDGTTTARLDPDTGERFLTLRRQLGVSSFGFNQIVLQPDLEPSELRTSQLHPTAARLQARLHAVGLAIEVQTVPDSTRTAPEAAAVVGCQVGQIVKSLVFVRGGGGSGAGEEPVMVLCAGDRRVDAKRLGLAPASADQARAATGFAIGGIPPLGHDRPLETLIDESLRRFATVWCAAGTPHAVFEISSEALIAAIPGATVLDVS